MKFTCKFVLFNTQISRKAYFNGESFIASSQKVSLLSEFEGGFNFRTLQPNGLLFYYSEGVSTSFFTVCFIFFLWIVIQENIMGIIEFLTSSFNESSLQYRSIPQCTHFHSSHLIR